MDWKLISDLLFELLKAFLVPLAGLAAAYLFKAFQKKAAELDQQQQWILDNVIEIAVKAAEQLYKSGDGAEKKAYALSVAEQWLEKYNITIDLHVLEAAIEAAVFDQFPKLPEG